MAEEGLTERQSMIVSLRQANRGILARLTSRNVQVDGIGVERHESFIQFLVDIGVITEEQIEQFDLQWESYLNDTLQKKEVEMQRLIAAQNGPKLIGPDGRRLT